MSHFIPGTIYAKGDKTYQVVAVAKHLDTGNEVVVFTRATFNGETFALNADNFNTQYREVYTKPHIEGNELPSLEKEAGNS